MQYGDLSNQRGPAIVINADLLVSIKKKWFGLKYELDFLLSSRHLLEHWFNKGDLSIYVVCIGELEPCRAKVEDTLAIFMAPYTEVFAIKYPHELNYIVEADHVVGYFYNEHTLVNERTTLKKHFQVPNVAEISYLLNGGIRQ